MLSLWTYSIIYYSTKNLVGRYYHAQYVTVWGHALSLSVLQEATEQHARMKFLLQLSTVADARKPVLAKQNKIR